MKTRHGIEALILGGTELLLIQYGEKNIGIPLLDTARIHVKAVIVAATLASPYTFRV